MGDTFKFLWNEARCVLLTDLWLAGQPSSECARQLGITRSAAMGKLRRLGLLRKERPLLARRKPTQKLPPPEPAQNLLKTEQEIEQPKAPPPKRKRPAKNPDRFFLQFFMVPLPPPPDPPIGSFGLHDLRQGHCRWPEGNYAPYRFCGARQMGGGSSYCLEHHARAISRASQRDFDRAAEQALAGKLFASRAGVMDA